MRITPFYQHVPILVRNPLPARADNSAAILGCHCAGAVELSTTAAAALWLDRPGNVGWM